MTCAGLFLPSYSSSASVTARMVPAAGIYVLIKGLIHLFSDGLTVGTADVYLQAACMYSILRLEAMTVREYNCEVSVYLCFVFGFKITMTLQ